MMYKHILIAAVVSVFTLSACGGDNNTATREDIRGFEQMLDNQTAKIDDQSNRIDELEQQLAAVTHPTTPPLRGGAQAQSDQGCAECDTVQTTIGSAATTGSGSCSNCGGSNGPSVPNGTIPPTTLVAPPTTTLPPGTPIRMDLPFKQFPIIMAFELTDDGFLVGKSLEVNGTCMAFADGRPQSLDVYQAGGATASGVLKPEWAEAIDNIMSYSVVERIRISDGFFVFFKSQDNVFLGLEAAKSWAGYVLTALNTSTVCG